MNWAQACAVLGVEGFRVGHAGVVVDHGVHILIADLLTGTGFGPAQDTPSASIRYFAQFLDVHVYQFTWYDGYSQSDADNG